MDESKLSRINELAHLSVALIMFLVSCGLYYVRPESKDILMIVGGGVLALLNPNPKNSPRSTEVQTDGAKVDIH